MRNESDNDIFSILNEALINIGVQNVVEHIVQSGGYKLSGGRIFMGSYQGGAGNSFVVDINSKTPGMWYENNPENSPNASGRGDLIDLWMLNRGLTKREAIDEIKAYVGYKDSHQTSQRRPALSIVKSKIPSVKENKERYAKHLKLLKPVAPSTLKKYKGRLFADDKAMDYLYSRGLSNDTIDYFNLGLSNDYTDKQGVLRTKALVSPLIRQDGTPVSPYAYYAIPEVTVNPIDENGWCASSPRMTYNTKRLSSHEWLVIVEGIKDLWALHQLIANTDLLHRIHIASSTHGSGIPVEVETDPTVLAGYKRIFLAQDIDGAGDGIAQRWLQHVGTRAFRLKAPFHYKRKGDKKDWTDYLKQGGDAKGLLSLMDTAEPMRMPSVKTATNIKELKPGFHGYDPIDISGAFTNGYMYYPVIVLESGVDPSSGNVGYSRVVKVIRSDRQFFDYHALPKLPRPGAIATPVYALSDGTLIADIPKTAPNPSWSWSDIDSWLEGNFTARPLKDIVIDLQALIAGQIWLPNKNDYLVLALIVVVTYVQNIFEAVPFVLATGAAGTGKSQLGELMAKVAANGTVVGDTSAATIARVLDETRGFLMLDDVEKIKSRVDNGNIQMDDFIQILKVSYKKSTAIKTVTDTKTMTVKRLNFYGVKFMTNTQGIEDILGTRTITVHTRRAPVGEFEPAELDQEKIDALKPELHAWAMDNCESLYQCYKNYPLSNRTQEITAPLRAIIDMTGVDEWQDIIDDLIERMKVEESANISPEKVVAEAAKRIALRGFSSLAIEQVIMEISTLVPDNFMKERTTDIPLWRQNEWVRKQLVNAGYISSSSEKRFRPYGKSRVVRLYEILPLLFIDLPKKNVDVSQLKSRPGERFCKAYATCKECPYADVPCEIRESTSKRRY